MQATQRSGEDAHLKLEVQEMTARAAAAEHAVQVGINATLDANVEQLVQQMAVMQNKLATTEAVLHP